MKKAEAMKNLVCFEQITREEYNDSLEIKGLGIIDCDDRECEICKNQDEVINKLIAGDELK